MYVRLRWWRMLVRDYPGCCSPVASRPSPGLTPPPLPPISAASLTNTPPAPPSPPLPVPAPVPAPAFNQAAEESKECPAWQHASARFPWCWQRFVQQGASGPSGFVYLAWLSRHCYAVDTHHLPQSRLFAPSKRSVSSIRWRLFAKLCVTLICL